MKDGGRACCAGMVCQGAESPGVKGAEGLDQDKAEGQRPGSQLQRDTELTPSLAKSIVYTYGLELGGFGKGIRAYC